LALIPWKRRSDISGWSELDTIDNVMPRAARQAGFDPLFLLAKVDE
jgi:hypothetical protein